MKSFASMKHQSTNIVMQSPPLSTKYHSDDIKMSKKGAPESLSYTNETFSTTFKDVLFARLTKIFKPGIQIKAKLEPPGVSQQSFSYICLHSLWQIKR